MKPNDNLFWIWLAEALGAANRDFRQLIDLYENPFDLFHADEAELAGIPSVSAHTKEALADKDLSGATAILDTCEKEGIAILPFSDDAYPNALRDLHDPPVLLYYRGTLPDWNRKLTVAMVGTRRMSAYGLRTAYRISYELASAGAVIVSGLAAGIDGVASAAAVVAKGSAVAVLGCGVDVVYPRHHKVLNDAVAQNGAVISEYPPATSPSHYHFPVRNRIISGLSQGTVVVEAGLGSGSLITAKDAILQGRDVFAVPANVGSVGAEGTNGLLRDGANLAIDSADILRKYEYVFAERLNMEAYAKAKTVSEADLSQLQRFGVIELTGSQTPASFRASPPEPKETKEPPRDRKRKQPSGAKTETAEKKKTATVPEPAKAPAAEPSSANQTREKTPDAVLSSLSPAQLAVLRAIPDDRAVTADSLTSLGFPYGETVAALTMLEIMGLIQKLPGALYIKS